MSNTWFKFRQFTIHQDRCAMKVSTDACIQGAWTPIVSGVKHVLDIGCGTGLLSLMLAQRSEEIQIDAIDIDLDAAEQATENVDASPWADRITVVQADVKAYNFTKQYDMIICNPPFFNNSLLGADAARNNVRHSLSLSYEDLFAVIQKALKPGGYASIMLPAAEHNVWEQLLRRHGWGIWQALYIHPKEGGPHNRVVSLCFADAGTEVMKQLYIYDYRGGYTEVFVDMLKPFYLYL